MSAISPVGARFAAIMRPTAADDAPTAALGQARWTDSVTFAPPAASPAARIATGFDATPVDTGGDMDQTLPRLARNTVDALRTAPADELWGEPDGPPIRLPSGIVLQPQNVAGARVTRDEVLQVVAGIYKLPQEDLQLIARQGVPVHLLPVPRLEKNQLGATKIVQDTKDGPWRPTRVRIAVRANLPGDEATSEVTQHELGHVVAVLKRQDVTEQAAIRYAASY